MSIRVAILGSGNIACDLLAKVTASRFLTCSMFVGQSASSRGIAYARTLGVPTSAEGISFLLRNAADFEIVCDATSAIAHVQHAPNLEALGKTILNLTPAPRGRWCVPAINAVAMERGTNINMVTCGGQASAPIAYALRKAAKTVEYIEAVSTISANSAGRATRLNVNEYLGVTEGALKLFSGCDRVKSILNISPADPPVTMQTTVFAKMAGSAPERIAQEVRVAVDPVRRYVPGYELIIEPILDGDRWMMMVRVTGAGAYLPSYSGNLDIITSAAVRVAETLYSHPHAREESYVSSVR